MYIRALIDTLGWDMHTEGIWPLKTPATIADKATGAIIADKATMRSENLSTKHFLKSKFHTIKATWNYTPYQKFIGV